MTSLEDMCAKALARDADRQAVEFEGHWYGWGDMRRVAGEVRELLADSGVGAGAPVALISRNRPAAIATLFGLIAQGQRVQMVYAFQSPEAVIKNLEKLDPMAVVATKEDATPELVSHLKDAGRAGIVLEGMKAQAIKGAEKVRGREHIPSPADRSIQILTSGTTGPPKQFSVTYDMVAKSHVGGGLPTPDMQEALYQGPPYLLYFPLGNITGIYTTVPSLVRGMRAVLLDRFSLDAWRDFIRRFQPEATGLPPAGIQMLLDADVPVEELSCVKAMGTGAAPLDPTVQKAFEAKYKIPILLSYGATEFGGPVTAMTLDLYDEFGEAKFASVGRPFGGARLRVIDPDTEEVLPSGEEGLLEVVSPRIGPDWIRTSDYGRIDEDGFLYLLGRADGAIMRGGFKVLPETIERALVLHPAVAAAGVVGVPDRRLGQTPGAAIVLKRGMEAPGPEELEAHLRAHVLATHIPTHWRFVDTLPKNPSFKVDRPGLARLFETGA